MHEAKACVIACIDFRFQDYLTDFLANSKFAHAYDLVSVAGASRDFVNPVEDDNMRYVWKELDISVSLHNPSTIIVVDHQDCGGYAQDNTIPAGLSEEEDFKSHEIYVTQLYDKLKETYPERHVEMYFMNLQGVAREF